MVNKLSLSKYLEKKERVLIILAALYAIFPLSFTNIQQINTDYAGYFAIAAFLALLVLCFDLLDEENLSWKASLLNYSIIAMAAIFFFILKDTFTSQVTGFLGFLLLGGLFALGMYIPIKLIGLLKDYKRNILFPILLLIIGLLTITFLENILAFLNLLFNGISYKTYYLPFAPFYGGILMAVTVYGTLDSIKEIEKHLKIVSKLKRIFQRFNR